MNTLKKIGWSIMWLTAYVAAVALVLGLRHIGTTWINNAGFFRVLVLAGLSIGSLIPLGLAILVWFSRPKHLYVKTR